MEPGVDQEILATVVLNESVAVIAAIELDDESSLSVIDVSPSDKSSLSVVEIRLNLWSWQAGAHQQPAKPGLHRRFSWHRQLSKSSQARARQQRWPVD